MYYSMFWKTIKLLKRDIIFGFYQKRKKENLKSLQNSQNIAFIM